jgi:hypothetical protein
MGRKWLVGVGLWVLTGVGGVASAAEIVFMSTAAEIFTRGRMDCSAPATLDSTSERGTITFFTNVGVTTQTLYNSSGEMWPRHWGTYWEPIGRG